MFKETLYQSASDGTPFVDCLKRQGVLPGIKVRRQGWAELSWQAG
jgi:fructose-bisphosphate aldolase class I